MLNRGRQDREIPTSESPKTLKSEFDVYVYVRKRTNTIALQER